MTKTKKQKPLAFQKLPPFSKLLTRDLRTTKKKISFWKSWESLIFLGFMRFFHACVLRAL